MSIVTRRRILETGVSCLDLASCGMQVTYFDNDIEGDLTLMVANPWLVLTQSHGAEDFDPAVELKAAKRRPASEGDEEEEQEEEDDEEEDEDDFDDDEDDDLDDEDDDDEDDFGEESLNDDYDDDDLDEDDVYYDDDEVE